MFLLCAMNGRGNINSSSSKFFPRSVNYLYVACNLQFSWEEMWIWKRKSFSSKSQTVSCMWLTKSKTYVWNMVLQLISLLFHGFWGRNIVSFGYLHLSMNSSWVWRAVLFTCMEVALKLWHPALSAWWACITCARMLAALIIPSSVNFSKNPLSICIKTVCY